MDEPRSTTLAFRLSVSERRQLDAVSKSHGLSGSEFARRAVLGGAASSAAALEQAVATGRDEARQRVEALQGELAQAREEAANWRRQAVYLENQLAGAPLELLTESDVYLPAIPPPRMTVAAVWSRIRYYERFALLSVLAAVIVEELERVVDAPTIDEETIDLGLSVIERAMWLMNTLTPETGRTFAHPALPRRHEWGPAPNCVVRRIGNSPLTNGHARTREAPKSTARG